MLAVGAVRCGVGGGPLAAGCNDATPQTANRSRKKLISTHLLAHQHRGKCIQVQGRSGEVGWWEIIYTRSVLSPSNFSHIRKVNKPFVGTKFHHRGEFGFEGVEHFGPFGANIILNGLKPETIVKFS